MLIDRDRRNKRSQIGDRQTSEQTSYCLQDIRYLTKCHWNYRGTCVSLVPGHSQFLMLHAKNGRAWCASACEQCQLHVIKYWRERSATASAWRRPLAHVIERTTAKASTRFPGKMAFEIKLSNCRYRDQSAEKEATMSNKIRRSIADRLTDRCIWAALVTDSEVDVLPGETSFTPTR